MALITLKTFRQSIDAHLLKSKLESEDIVCYLQDENMVSLKLHNHAYQDGMKLLINDFDFEKATKIIATIDGATFNDDFNKKINCPNCKSIDLVNTSQPTTGIKGVLTIMASFFLMLNPFYKKRKYNCKNCGLRF